MKIITQIIIIVAVGAASYSGWLYREHIPFISSGKDTVVKNSQRKSLPTNVTVSPVIVRELPYIVSAVGTARANQDITVTSKVMAKIQKIEFKEGQTVERGKVLVRFDSTELKANMAESVAERENSRKLYERAKKLYKSRNVPKARVDLLLSELQADDAKVSADKARLNDFIIRAPFSGTLGFHEVSIGALVRPGETITTLDDTSLIKLDFEIPEGLLARIEPGQEFKAKGSAYEDLVFTGVVSSIGTRIDTVTRMAKIRGIISNDNDKLKPGMFLSVELLSGVDPAALMIPEEAVLAGAAGHVVYKVIDGKAVRTSVSLGRRIKGQVQVLNGVVADDQIVVAGLQKIRDGALVKIENSGSDKQ